MLLSESVTQLLIEWNAGDPSALERLTPLVYDDLRRRAGVYLHSERNAETLQATALVHEAYLQILDLRNIDWKSRAHFVNMVALLMRRILVDHARERQAAKRNFGEREVSLSQAEQIVNSTDVNLIDLDEALQRFAKDYPRQAQVVELKFFGGLNTEEIAEVMRADGIETSIRTVKRDWTFAKTWLFQVIGHTDI